MYQNNGKKIVATIEVRMTSSRLPGKVMLPLAGKPSTERLIERLKRSNYIDEIVVATTINKADQPLEDLAEHLDVHCFRGSEQDVLGRVLGAAQSVNGDIICEVTGDCPLVDPKFIDHAIEELFTREVDYVTNFVPVSFPIGFDAQVFSTKILSEVDKITQDPLDRVHVSYYIYTHPKRYRIYNWTAESEYYWPELRVTLDEEADYHLLDAIYSRLITEKPAFEAIDVIRLLRREPELLNLNKHVRQKDISEG